jgi:hypothetical protein
MSPERAREMVEELLDAHQCYEQATGIYVPSARKDYHATKQAVIAALTEVGSTESK